MGQRRQWRPLPILAAMAALKFGLLAFSEPSRTDAHAAPLRRQLVQGLAQVGLATFEPVWAAARTSEERTAAQVFRDATPGVVSVSRGLRPGERRRSGEDGLPPSLGSGFVWDQMHVVTNYHVVRDIGPQDLQIVFLDTTGGGGGSGSDDFPKREVLKGELIGSDPFTDTAVIRITSPSTKRLVPMHPLPIGESATLEVGQSVYAIGNPFGLDHSMSKGIISGKSRTLDIGERPIQGCIQTDASINPGNSGGPLLDAAGRVIGVNTAILTASGTSAGVGLAIPVDTVKKNVELILKQGFVSRGFLGITFAPDGISDALQIPGIIVYSVVANSPAEKAGVRPMLNGTVGDVITTLDDKPIRTGSDIFKLLDKHVPGDLVFLGVRRARRSQDGAAVVENILFNITLSASPRKK